MDGDIDPFIESFMRWRWQGGTAGEGLPEEEADEDL